MIKECQVILNNESVSVVKFGNTEVQLPPIGKDVNSVKVKCEDGRYSIVKDEAVAKMKKKTWTTKHKKQPITDVDCIELNITEE
jgi:hypothetical protein